jgi:hypothetical protein
MGEYCSFGAAQPSQGLSGMPSETACTTKASLQAISARVCAFEVRHFEHARDRLNAGHFASDSVYFIFAPAAFFASFL